MAYLKDISASLGLSVSTVSRALRGYPDISEETREKVLHTAEELDYGYKRRGPMSRAAQNTGAVGVLAPGIEKLLGNGYYREMLCAMTAEAALHNRDLVVMGSESTESGMSWIGRVVSRNVSGVCLLAGREELYRGEFADLIESGIPLVSIEHEVAGHMTVYSSHRENIRLLLAYLKDKGYRRVVHIGATGPESERLAVLFAQEAEKLNMTCLEASEGERGPGMITSVKKQPEEIGRIAVRKLIYIAEHPEADCGERIFVPGEICEGTAAGQAEVGLAVEIPLEIIT